MSDIYVVYFSSTGNTEEMAKHVADGIERKGGNPVLTEIGSADPDHLKEASAFALGCPACGAEELDESMESLIEEISGSLEGKHVDVYKRQLLSWKAGIRTNFTCSAGKSGKYLYRSLSQEDWDRLIRTYAGGRLDEMWEAADAMCVLFHDCLLYTSRCV